MERPLNPKLHLICGMCGNANMLKFRIGKEINDDLEWQDGKPVYKNVVYISCKNCSTLTSLDEHIEQITK